MQNNQLDFNCRLGFASKIDLLELIGELPMIQELLESRLEI